MAKYGIGQPVLRFEDPRLLRGEGRYIHDVNLPGQAYTVLVRSPHAHAKIRSIDVAAARKAPGVVAVFTGADYAADNLGVPKVNMPRKKADGSPMFAPPRPALCVDRVRYVGDPVAMVIADTLAQAKDAAELVEVDYEPLPSSTDTGTTTQPGAPPVYDECPDNVSHVMERGNKAATDAAFAKAAKIIRRRYVVTRVHAQYMEPRGAIGNFDAQENRLVLYADVQYPHRVRTMLAQSIFRVPEGDMRVIAGDVGGGFGSKGWQYVEHRLTVWAARKLRRPVKWTCERSEAVMADEHGRDNIGDIELALDADNRFIGLRLHMLANIGAYIGSDRNLLTPFGQIGTVVGVYDIPAAYVHITGLLSNTNPTAPYRGAGRPEAIYLIERLVDDAARELGVDRVELRRKNMLPASALPYQSPLGPYYDCGAFEQNLDMALKLADVPGFAARKAASKTRGKLRGLGIVNAIEQAAGTVQPEYAEVRFTPSGTALLLMGTKAQGQGHETMYKQILNEKLGIDPADVKFIDGDTDRVAFGMGTMGSRSTVIGGSALFLAADKVIAKGKKIAAHILEAGEQDIEFADNTFTVAGTDKKVSLKQVAMAAFQPGRLPKGEEMGLFENATYLSPRDTYPNGCHICEVEIDPETGEVKLDRYAVVDDVGTVMNPIGLKGQIHGGVAQGVGQILMERVVWDRQTGQLYTASFMDYAMPRADTLCSMEIKSNPVPTKFNPLGAKGAGEAGTVGAMPVVMNAVMDALAELGVRELDMPATSDRVWAAIQNARPGA
ncbi:MAG: xanthine dehydrogenase family protein molybdopterin-binding subunit [Alphaproteobacteria bacterium]|nr:xanthine dehydrogenase family protein molybdopterin-binding subunit [Alphaproteobacteria bacterium]